MNFLGGTLGGGGKHRKNKGFSSNNKVQQYHGDGSESIIVMGRPFRVLQKISDVPPPYLVGRQRAMKYGEGGSSYVYLVENSSNLPEFPRHMALKRSFFGVDQVAEAHREVDIVSRIKDKNIVRVFHSEISRNEGRLGVSIAMEYCSNNLHRRISGNSGISSGMRLTEAEICHVMLALTSALGYLHTQQPPITHRDIRPENILINNKYVGPAAYKLANFGNATMEAYHCETREEANMAIADIQMHTNPAFRAPEMSDPWSKKRICEKTDMWAIGVLLYYMMYLRLPFDQSSSIGQGDWVVRFPQQTSSSYTGSLRVMLQHLLDPNPDSRWDVFALTNFMRFDEDCSRHLGTFCFTTTEWPEGWEEQDVKVLGRAMPAKAPPVSYREPGHEQLTSHTPDTHGDGHGAVLNKHGDVSTNGTAAGGDPVMDAMIVLGGDPADDDAEMAEYRRQIIEEQENAWKRLKATAGHQAASSAGESHQENETAAAPAEAVSKVEKKDVFDDLFAGPSVVASTAPTHSSGTGPSAPPAAAEPQRDVFNADDLFSAPASQMQPPNPMMVNSWGSGAPMMGSGMYPVPQSQYPQQTPWGYGGNGANVYSPPPPFSQQQGPQSAYPIEQPSYQSSAMPQQSMNFMAPAPGQQPARNAPAPEAKPTPSAPVASKKDPFADLFN
ncbi:hypothetical protein JKF63_06113 [Porcisia hertigi]|uniref:non-specific serine/threonine protein kinase n=1 Tax=Porcisia hertigi TaxID=2761500 RepID=A0A836LEI4_9TRYP|nr:hypothetical protein JKF63_06113 [Porcisia hertigi]